MSEDNAAVAGPAGPPGQPQEPPPPQPPVLPLWRLYAYAIATFGVFLPIWVYKVARRQGAGRERTSTPVWWAFGSLVLPVCMALLYHLARDAAATSDPRADLVSRGRAALPPLLLAGIALLWELTPLSQLWVLPLLLLPLPFLCAQHEINRRVTAAPETAAAGQLPPLRRRGLQLGLTIAGLASFGGVAWRLDGEDLARILAAESVGATIRGASEVYELRIPGRSWLRVATGSHGDKGSDLELTGPGGDTWLVAYADSTPGRSIEETVDDRRQRIFDALTLAAVEEKRYFLESHDLIPASLAIYRVSPGLGIQASYVVLTIRLETHLVEVIGYTAEEQRFDAVQELVLSFKAVDTPGHT